MESSTTREPRDDALDAIVNVLVHHHKEFFGRGPDHARAFVFGDTLVCLLEGVLTPAEERLVKLGEGDTVDQQRYVAQRAMRADVTGAIETHLHRRVRSFMSANDSGEKLMVEVFVLDAPLELAYAELPG